jgi:hypothetical protein
MRRYGMMKKRRIFHPVDVFVFAFFTHVPRGPREKEGEGKACNWREKKEREKGGKLCSLPPWSLSVPLSFYCD